MIEGTDQGGTGKYGNLRMVAYRILKYFSLWSNVSNPFCDVKLSVVVAV